MKKLLLLRLLVSGSAFGSEACDLAAKYAGLGFLDAKNNMPEKNRLEEIDSRIDKEYRTAAEAGMRYGRVLFASNPKSNQGEIEYGARRGCE
jgi:hypothetical protein